ncbi:MAG: hypothetical protein HYY06_25280 [Deltaproteobacteria bacterium]|nr:hypothetical protein [Deltaproteobacteria bacterium]
MRRTWHPLLALMLLTLSALQGCGRSRRDGAGDDDDDDDVAGDGGSDADADGDLDIDGGPDPCPGLMCCPGKDCPPGFLCDTDRGACLDDPCAGTECCDTRPCADDGMECLDGTCVPVSTVGEPCMSEGECNGPGASCLPAPDWIDGYCTQDCVAGACPGDGVCVSKTCFDGCLIPENCRLGYSCDDVPGGLVCRPST